MDEIDLILVMTVNPGFGGQKFISSQIKKIAEIRQRIDDSDREIDLQVDGGIDHTTAKLVVDAGANVLVAGTASFKGGPGAYADNIDRLRVSLLGTAAMPVALPKRTRINQIVLATLQAVFKSSGYNLTLWGRPPKALTYAPKPIWKGEPGSATISFLVNSIYQMDPS